MLSLQNFAPISLDRDLDWKTLALTDRQTQVPNRWSFDLHLEALERQQTSVTIAMLDVDKFKSFVDAHGHVAADRAVNSVAQALNASVQDFPDILLARYGGDEFGAIALSVHPTQLGNLLTQAIRKSGFTASVGIAQGIASWNLVQAADTAVFQAKSQGRDRFVIYQCPNTHP